MTTSDENHVMQTQKPRLALMGEFSSGKSTLSNMLVGGASLPMRVTATRLPPVWMRQGDPAAILVAEDGTETQIDIADLQTATLEDARLIRVFCDSDMLELCELIDMPGISDPNMMSDVWMSVLDEVDSVVWCTNATQAWRQSEAAVWEQIMSQTNGNNILLVTQVDRLQNERDVRRVVRRVQNEAGHLFKAIYPISILDALNAGDDEEKWCASGAAAFAGHLVEMLLSPTSDDQMTAETSEGEGAPAERDDIVVDQQALDFLIAKEETAVHDDSHYQEEGGYDGGQTARINVSPRRVRMPQETQERAPRPPRRQETDTLKDMMP